MPLMAKTMAFVRRLARDARGVALIEFAYATPVVMAITLYGLELSNLALANLRTSQIATTVADTASRVGENATLAEKRIRESDVNDVFEYVRRRSGVRDIATRGRIILSSLERNPAGGNWIQWQRCIGARNEVSSYGVEGDGATGTGFAGMGPPGQELQAPVDGAVMFAEVVYAYKPIIHERLLGETIIRARSAFLVRERRDLDNSTEQVNPDDTGTPSSCAVFTP